MLLGWDDSLIFPDLYNKKGRINVVLMKHKYLLSLIFFHRFAIQAKLSFIVVLRKSII